MKNEEFKKQMKKIRPSDELIEKTIENIKNVNKVKNGNKVKKLIAGTAAALTLSVGSVGAYIAVTGNTQILEKIGINLSQKYEENEQIITEENSSISKFSAEGIEATLKSAAIDNGSLVMEIDFKLDEKFQDKEFNIKIEDVNVFIPSRNSSWGELIISERDSIQKMEDGTYKMFKYLALEDPVTAGTGIWIDSFYEDEVVNCTVKFGNLTDKDGNLLIKDKNNDWKFEFELKKPDNLNEDIEIPDQVIEKIQYKDVEINVNSIKNSSFGNIITINAVQKNIDINKINDIQKIDFIVKDLNGNKINVISRTQNITMGDYKNGSMTLVCLEDIRLTVDDTTENAEYKIEIIEATKPVISIEKIQGINEELLKDFKNGNSVLSIDGGQQLRETLDKKGLEYYIDEYGVYRIDKTNDEIYGENIVDSQEKNEIENPININNGEKMLTSSELASIAAELNLSMYNGFINEYNTYTNPSEIYLGEVFYNGAGFDNQITDEEIVEYEKFREFYETDMRKVTTEQIKTLYLNCTGEELTDINNRLNDWVYLEKYDAYYIEAGDTNYQEISCKSGYVKADGVTYVLNLSNGCTTTIKVNPESYGFEFIFISNVNE